MAHWFVHTARVACVALLGAAVVTGGVALRARSAFDLSTTVLPLTEISPRP